MVALYGTAESLEIVAIESPPFVCTDQLPCKPAILPTSYQGDCIYGGLKTRNGNCIHGYLIDLISVASSQGMANVSFNLWHTTSKITGGYNNLVHEIFNPGSTNPSAPLCGNKTCDLAIGDITINWPRRRITNARFSAPYMDVGLRILARMMNPNVDAFNFNFLQPFTTRLWLLILATLVFMTFAIVFVESSNFRARYVYLKKDSSGPSWQETSISRSSSRIPTGKETRQGPRPQLKQGFPCVSLPLHCMTSPEKSLRSRLFLPSLRIVLTPNPPPPSPELINPFVSCSWN